MVGAVSCRRRQTRCGVYGGCYCSGDSHAERPSSPPPPPSSSSVSNRTDQSARAREQTVLPPNDDRANVRRARHTRALATIGGGLRAFVCANVYYIVGVPAITICTAATALAGCDKIIDCVPLLGGGNGRRGVRERAKGKT